eukprot:GHUV01010912.1.p1 GENE.GHUV01010912.1~~GHUV01010912.1.p1  ORF type:complete len:205 (+),score=39.82 GHUV01010912.1:185-799(+)
MRAAHAQQHHHLWSQLWPAQRTTCRRVLGRPSRHRVDSCYGSAPVTLGGCSEPQQCTCGVVVVDHGSRRKASNDMLLEFCSLYQQITNHSIIEPAHMEIAEPTIAQAIGRCVAAGAKHVVVAPYFLGKGRHIQDDIPALVAAVQEQYPDVQCSIAEPIGIDPLMVKLIQNRVHAVLEEHCPAVASSAYAAEEPVSATVAATSSS